MAANPLDQFRDQPGGQSSSADVPDERDPDRLILDPSIGRQVGGASPAQMQEATPETGGPLDQFRVSAGPAASANPNVGQFAGFSISPSGPSAPIPLPEVAERQAAVQWLASLQYGENQNPFVKADVLTHVRSLEMAPEVAYVLRNPDVIDEYQVQVWPYVLDAMVNGVDENGEPIFSAINENLAGATPGYTPLPLNASSGSTTEKQWEATAAFAEKHSPKFSPEEMDFVYTILGSIPNAADMLAENDDITYYGNEDDNFFKRWWGNLRTGFSILGNEPAVLSTSFNDPRFNILAQMDVYLDNNDISDYGQRDEFFQWLLGSVDQEADRINRIRAGGFDEFAERTVNIGINTSKYAIQQGMLNNPITAPRSPDEYLWKDGLTNGQVLAASMGFNPADGRTWGGVSGFTDGVLDFAGDPLTWMGGAGAGARNVKNIPRLVSRPQAIAAALNPFGGGSRLGFGILDRGLIPRAMWAFTSKHIDDFTDTKSAWRAWNWIAKTSSQTDITTRIPALKSAHANDVKRLADATTGKEVQAIWRGFMTGTDPSTAKSAQQAQEEIFSLKAATQAYSQATRRSLADGVVNIRGMNKQYDNVDEVLEPVGIVEPYVQRAARGNALEGTGVKALPDELARSAAIDQARTAIGTIGVATETVGRATLKGGDEITILSYAGGEAGDVTYVAKNAADEIIGAVHKNLDKGKGVYTLNEGTRADMAWQGVMSALWDAAEEAGDDLLQYSGKSASTSGEAALFAQTRAARIVDEAAGPGTAVFRKSAWSGSGAKRAVVSTLGMQNLKQIDLDDLAERQKLLAWLLHDDNSTKGAREVAAALEEGSTLDNVGSLGVDVLREYLQQARAASMKQGDLRLMGGYIDDSIYHGFDTAESLAPSTKHADLAGEMRRLDQKALGLRDTIDKNMWVTLDIPRTHISTRAQMRLARLGRHLPNGKYLRGIRRQGFQMAHSLPSNISLTEGVRGGTELKNWMKVLGGGEELGKKWGDAFVAADMTRRKGIAEAAFRELGEQSGNLILKNDLIEFMTKQGHVTYALGRGGNDIGLTGQGSIIPMTITHLTNQISMPPAKEMLRALRRYEGAAKKGSIRFRKGLVNYKGRGAGARRAKIVDRLKARMVAKGMDPGEIDPDDWLTIGYADTLASVTGRSRPDAMGAVNQTMRILTSPYWVLHGTFIISQLALRPFAWSGRVLMEEGIRSDLMGLPSLWRNPREYIGGIMDASAIFKMSDDVSAQAKYIDLQVAKKLFPNGEPNWSRIKKTVPDLDELLDANKVDPAQVGRVQAVIAHELGRSLIGGEATTTASLGSRYNPFRRAAMRQRRIGRAHRRLDDTGLLESFRWQTDGLEIANRTFWQSFVSELSSGFLDMEWRAGRMAPDQIDAYGTGYARSIFQMLGEDPLVRSFGLNRAVARTSGAAHTYDTAALLAHPKWKQIEPLVHRKMIEDGLDVTEVDEATWYLTNVVDEITDTLLDPLAQGSAEDKARIAQGLLDRNPIDVDMGDGVIHKLSMTRDNYEGFADSMRDLSHTANSLGKNLPHTVSAQMDHRFGQHTTDLSRWRRATDWVMQKAGEGSSQTLFRRPGYLHVHKRYYDYAISMGNTPDMARAIAAEKAAETVNWIFFNNKDIPQFLHDMNKVFPFFSAMWEVSQTWAYKIPAHEGWPVGAAHLVRRVDRTIDALHNVGLLETDLENGEMSLRLSPEGALTGPLLAATRAPAYLAQHLVGVGRMLLEPFDADGKMVEPYRPADLSAWMKDGFEFAIGNPLDPTSHGIMAVNQLSVGLTPVLGYPAGMLTKAAFAADTKVIKTEGMTVEDFAAANPEADMAEMLYINQDAIKELNGPEAYARAIGRDGDPTSLNLPASVEMPKTSLWETVIDETVFPFGRIETPGRMLTSVSPAALNHVWRALFTAFGQEDSEIVGYFLGNMSTYQMTGEVINAMQRLEATEGVGSEISALTVEMLQLAEKNEIEVRQNPDEAYVIYDSDRPGADDVRELIDKIERKEEAFLARAHNNAMGTMLIRGLTGSLLPATPRIWDDNQLAARAFWNQKDIAENARIRGDGIDVAAMLQSMPAQTGEDLAQAMNVVKAFWDDSSGSAAKIWVRQNMPEMEPYLKGKTFWGEDGLPVEAEHIDQWGKDLQDGKIKPFDPEVWFSRMQRAAISTSRDVAIKLEYGNDPNTMAQQILMDQARYDEVVEPFDMEFEAQEFIDAHMFDGKYDAWRTSQQDDSLSELSMQRDRLRYLRDAVDAIGDMLNYVDMTPEERRQMMGQLSSAQRALSEGVEEMDRREGQDENPWRSPHEKIIDRYWDKVAGKYYEDRALVFQEFIDPAQTSWERSAGFDRLRILENDHFLTEHTVEGHNGTTVQVPNEMVRAWNRLPQQQRQERILATMDKKPEWLNLFQSGILIDAAPQLAQVLPTTPEVLYHYERASADIRALQEAHYRSPKAMTESQVEKRVREIKERRDQALVAMGRRQEVEYRESWVPAEQLDFAGMLPESLRGALPQLRSILNSLRAQDKSPTTNQGEQYFLQFRTFLEAPGGYFDQVPGAAKDFEELGKAMFNETFPSAVHARLWQGDRFGKLE